MVTPMDQLIKEIKTLQQTKISNKIEEKIKIFTSMKHQHIDTIFPELCYCILTANCPAKRCMNIQNHLTNDFLNAPTDEISKKLKKHGYRFPNTRAEYITTSRTMIDIIKQVLETYDHDQRRKWLVENIKGFGYKESSHFLRNIGYLDYAIVDTHIIDLLNRYGIIKPVKNITSKTYLTIEKKLDHMAKELQISLGELDLYLWYLETGAILK